MSERSDDKKMDRVLDFIACAIGALIVLVTFLLMAPFVILGSPFFIVGWAIDRIDKRDL